MYTISHTSSKNLSSHERMISGVFILSKFHRRVISCGKSHKERTIKIAESHYIVCSLINNFYFVFSKSSNVLNLRITPPLRHPQLPSPCCSNPVHSGEKRYPHRLLQRRWSKSQSLGQRGRWQSALPRGLCAFRIRYNSKPINCENMLSFHV